MNQDELSKQLNNLSDLAQGLSSQLSELSQQALTVSGESGAAGGHLPFVALFTVFVLACFVGYHVVWRVTPALHSPLMAVTNAISSVIIVGALIAAGAAAEFTFSFSEVMGFAAIVLASVNICGGFLVTYRMLSMFKKKQK
ncbi:MAG TPA: NAD(P) transhydrogenase subunit alpha [Verrucomicrobiae bacterium]|jgi:H+-translocating NAD(P) transhydrogenase subunit alpha|nr:NAD(P) transhydrogenase subunit alpha [Verrucomicrobiae bacterium]